ncbi:MAG: enoyl-CoA hydratase/isomerase family protein [Pyrinomonadaceae bacterium]
MNDPSLEIETVRGRMIVAFQRPQFRNPINSEVISALEKALELAMMEGKIEEIIFTGSGASFASGADIAEIERLSEISAVPFAIRGQRFMDNITASAFPTTAYINGYCYGGGLDLALACRRRFAVPDAAFCHPGARLGIMTGWGGTQRLPRLIGEGRALEMFLTAEPIDAAEALRIGLIDGIYSDLDSIPKPQETVAL